MTPDAGGKDDKAAGLTHVEHAVGLVEDEDLAVGERHDGSAALPVHVLGVRPGIHTEVHLDREQKDEEEKNGRRGGGGGGGGGGGEGGECQHVHYGKTIWQCCTAAAPTSMSIMRPGVATTSSTPRCSCPACAHFGAPRRRARRHNTGSGQSGGGELVGVPVGELVGVPGGACGTRLTIGAKDIAVHSSLVIRVVV